MSRLIQDLKFALRHLLKSPGFTSVAVLIMALGIGANTAIFSVVHAVLLEPLPFQDADRLVQLWHVPPQSSLPGDDSSLPSRPRTFWTGRSRTRYSSDMALYSGGCFELTRRQAGDHQGSRVTADFFAVLGVQPLFGRVFTAGRGSSRARTTN